MIISRVVLKEVAEVVLKEEEEHVVDKVVEEEEDIKMIEGANNINQNKVDKTLPHLTLVSVLHLQIIVTHTRSKVTKYSAQSAASNCRSRKEANYF